MSRTVIPVPTARLNSQALLPFTTPVTTDVPAWVIVSERINSNCPESSSSLNRFWTKIVPAVSMGIKLEKVKTDPVSFIRVRFASTDAPGRSGFSV